MVPIVAWSYEPLYILGAQNKIVGVEKGSQIQYSYLPGMEDIPVVGTYKEPDYEKIIQVTTPTNEFLGICGLSTDGM